MVKSFPLGCERRIEKRGFPFSSFGRYFVFCLVYFGLLHPVVVLVSLFCLHVYQCTMCVPGACMYISAPCLCLVPAEARRECHTPETRVNSGGIVHKAYILFSSLMTVWLPFTFRFGGL